MIFVLNEIVRGCLLQCTMGQWKGEYQLFEQRARIINLKFFKLKTIKQWLCKSHRSFIKLDGLYLVDSLWPSLKLVLFFIYLFIFLNLVLFFFLWKFVRESWENWGISYWEYPKKMKSILKIKVSSVITEHTALTSLKVSSASKSSSDNLSDTIPSMKTNKTFSPLQFYIVLLTYISIISTISWNNVINVNEMIS